MMLYDNTQVTVELRELVESGIKVWDFEYPSFYEGAEKTAFEQKVIDHYYFRQIGQETPARWLHYFRTRIREIMPYYKQLYETVKIMEALDDPFGNLDVTETFEQTSTGEKSGSLTAGSLTTSTTSTNTTTNGETESSTQSEDSSTGERSDNNTKKFSNTPQGTISNLDDHLTEATVETITSNMSEEKSSTGSSTGKDSSTTTGSSSATDETESNTTTTDTSTDTVTHTLHRKGNQGVNTYAHDMLEYRETLLNIDMLIINELNDLFLMVY